VFSEGSVDHGPNIVGLRTAPNECFVWSHPLQSCQVILIRWSARFQKLAICVMLGTGLIAGGHQVSEERREERSFVTVKGVEVRRASAKSSHMQLTRVEEYPPRARAYSSRPNSHLDLESTASFDREAIPEILASCWCNRKPASKRPQNTCHLVWYEFPVHSDLPP